MRAQDEAAAVLLSAELQETQYYLDAEKEEQVGARGWEGAPGWAVGFQLHPGLATY